MTSRIHNSSTLRGLFLLGVTLCVPALAAAQAPATPASQIDQIFASLTAKDPGCVVAVAHHGKAIINRAYGLADLEREVALTPDSVFDVGSVVKQFVAASTLLLVEEGRLSLTEDVHKYLPELPDYGHRITLDHLLTHTSGIRDWTGLGPLTGREVDALSLTLRQRRLNFAPGEEWSYSNGGYVLLKEIVARTSGMSFAEFTRTRLFEPLGMKSTTYLVDMRDIVKNRALAYDKAPTGWKLDVQLGNDRGGGGALLSTASDLIIWNAALTSARFGKFVSEKIQEPATLSNGRKLGYGRGLFLDANRGGRVVWHSGGAAGYGSMLSRFPEQDLSVAVLCNAGDTVEPTMFARRIFEVMVPAAATESQPSAPAAAGSLESADIKSKAGLFFNESTGVPMRLAVEKGSLRIQGGPALQALPNNRFRNPRGALSFMSQDEFELHFLSVDAFEIKSMEGKTTRFRRAQAYAPTAADMQMFVGRFTNDETRAVLEMTPGKQGLMVRFNDAQAFEFRPVDRDTFQLGGMFVRFRRDNGGAVVALEYSNPLIRHIEFVRQ